MRCRAVVAEQLALEDDGRNWKAMLPVDLEVHGKWFTRAKQGVNIK
jgi:hypothetical protein